MKDPEVISQAPGRINIIGEHVDYNDGFVLPAAIDKKMTTYLKRNGTKSRCRVLAKNLNEHFEFDLNLYNPLTKGWQNYVMGVISELHNLGANFEGFDLEFEGNVPIGSGMSSSAALECSIAYGLNELFDLALTKWELIKACQMAEHNFVDIKCGIMDQFASIYGIKDHVMLLDCRSLEYEYIPFNLDEHVFLLLNTNVSHTLASSEYNQRRSECEKALVAIQNRFPKVQSLRDITQDELNQSKASMSINEYKRCHHVLSEKNRVLHAVESIRNNDFGQLGKLMFESHKSLQKDYEVSCIELDFLVGLAEKNKFVIGSRMMGGGFGGCTLNLIDSAEVDAFVDFASTAYKQHFGLDLTPYVISLEDGAKIL